MKIAIVGYSGSGKSTLADYCGKVLGIPVLHLDTVQFLPGWAERSDMEKTEIIQAFLLNHSDWVIDGNYSRFFYEQRMEEADQIIFLNFSRMACLIRAARRYFHYRNTVRPDMAPGCKEKLDWEFVRWILWEGRSKSARHRYDKLTADYSGKTIIIHNQRELNSLYQKIKSEVYSGGSYAAIVYSGHKRL